jgi:PRTRC genetic system protein C
MTTTRVFNYDNREFPDPDPTKTPEEIMKTLLPFFPELITGEVQKHDPEKPEDPVIFEFLRKTGKKGTL